MDTRRGGFTLIELLSVMAVMVMITTIVVASGFGLRRSATYTSAMQVPLSVIEYAHQRACMDGRRTAVLFAPNGKSGEYAASVFQEAGKVAGRLSGANSGIIDKFSDIAVNTNGFNVLTIFNFAEGGTFLVGKVGRETQNEVHGKVDFKASTIGGDETADGANNAYYFPCTFIYKASSDKTSIGDSTWPTGSSYGFEVADRQVLPNNFSYSHKSGGHTGKDDSFWFIFNPDGTTDKHASVVMSIKEKVGKNRQAMDLRFN